MQKAIGIPEQPRIYRYRQGEAIDYSYTSLPPYFPATHPNTLWIINRMRSGEAGPLVNILKTRDKMNIFFKHMYFQIIDKPSIYDPTNPLDQPMFNEKTYLYLNVFSVALYFRCDAIVRTLAENRVAKKDNEASYESVSECSVPQFASHVYDHSLGDLLTVSVATIMMRREAYFAISPLFKFGAWNPKTEFTVSYYRRNYHSVRKFSDWMEYAWSLLGERPYTKIAQLVIMLNKAAHSNFYLGQKMYYQPINVRYYNAPYLNPELDQRSIVIYRSYPRRMLCKLFLHKEPLRVMPQVIPFVRVFQRERFFVSQTAAALNPEFRASIQSNLEERLINLSPVENRAELNSFDFVEKYAHKTSIYDFDNIVALLLHFLVLAADRNVTSLKNSIVTLVMDILTDTGLLYAFSKEPAVNISYYLSFLVDGPFIQPNDLQHMLKNIPVLLLKSSSPGVSFPPLLATTDTKCDKQLDKGYQLFKKTLPRMWETGKTRRAIKSMMEYRIDIDADADVTTLDYCQWKNEYLTNRLSFNLQTPGQTQQTKAVTDPSQHMFTDDDGHAFSAAQGWKAYPKTYFGASKTFLVKTASNVPKRKKAGKKQKFIDLWTLEELGQSLDK